MSLQFRTIALLCVISMGTHVSILTASGRYLTGTAGSKPLLHLIFFEDYPHIVSSQAKSGSFTVVELPSSTFAQQFSLMYVPFRKLQRFALPEGFEIPRKVILLDIHTISDQPFRNGRVSYRNAFTDLSYQLQATNWDKNSYQIILNGEYNTFKFTNIPVKIRANQTTLVTMQKTSRQVLYAAFTPTQAIPLLTNFSSMKDGVLHNPQIIATSQPLYPFKSSDRKSVTVRGVITLEGKMDPDRLILLECPHPILGMNALESVINDWQFHPAVQDGAAVEAPITVTVDFVPQ